VVSSFLRDPGPIGAVRPDVAGALGSYALIGVLVGALFAGSPLVTLPPLALFKMPEPPAWLVSRGRAQAAGGPGDGPVGHRRHRGRDLRHRADVEPAG
jgi:hypothetical protein